VPILAGEGVPHYSSAESETRLATKVTPQMPIEQGLSEHMDYSDTLNDSGILVFGSIDPGLVKKCAHIVNRLIPSDRGISDRRSWSGMATATLSSSVSTR